MKRIKEISLVTNCISSEPCMCYKDHLRVSRGWISYKRLNPTNDNIIIEWSIKTRDYNVIGFEALENFVNCEIELRETHPKELIKNITDIGGFCLRTFFTDGKYIDIKGFGDLYFNHLDTIATTLFDLIPIGLECPDFIKPELESD